MQAPWESLRDAEDALGKGLAELAASHLATALEAVPGGELRDLTAEDRRNYERIRLGITELRSSSATGE